MTPTADLGSLCFAWLQPYCVAEICPQTGLPCVTMTHAKHTGINKSQVVTADNQWTAEGGTFHLLAWVIFQVDTFCLLECQPTFFKSLLLVGLVILTFLPFLKTFHICVHHFLFVFFIDYFF